MSQIEASSKQIAQIIGVIDEIASRPTCWRSTPGSRRRGPGDRGARLRRGGPGSAGPGQRSADAAKEIKGLISTSNDHVSQGVRLVGETGEALGDIVGKVAEIDSLINEIARSSGEQSSGLAQVNSRRQPDGSGDPA